MYIYTHENVYIYIYNTYNTHTYNYTCNLNILYILYHLAELDGAAGGVAVGPREEEGRNRPPVLPHTHPPAPLIHTYIERGG